MTPLRSQCINALEGRREKTLYGLNRRKNRILKKSVKHIFGNQSLCMMFIERGRVPKKKVGKITEEDYLFQIVKLN